MKFPAAIHGGNVHGVARSNGRPISRIIDFSASINPLGLSHRVRRALVDAIPLSIHYPDPKGDDLRKQIGQSFRIDPGTIVLGNGSAELISVCSHVPLVLRHGLVIGPTFMEFERALRLSDARCTYLHASADDRYDPPLEQAGGRLKQRKNVGQVKTGRASSRTPIDGIFLCNPNSPTGRAVSPSRIRHLLRRVQQMEAHLIVDEAFVDFHPSSSVLHEVASSDRLIVIRSFTKFFAMPGLRIGYLVCPPDLATRISELLPPWSMNSLAQAAALTALQDTAYRRRSLAWVGRERLRFVRQLRGLSGVRVFPSQANFVLLELPKSYLAARIADWCQERGVLVRDCQDFAGMNGRSLRLAVRRANDNDHLVKLLRRALTVCQ